MTILLNYGSVREKIFGKVPCIEIDQNLGFIEADFGKIEKRRAKLALFQYFPAVFDLIFA